jgi:hypothetical protein
VPRGKTVIIAFASPKIQHCARLMLQRTEPRAFPIIPLEEFRPR